MRAVILRIPQKDMAAIIIKQIARGCKSVELPRADRWLNEVADMHVMEKVPFVLSCPQVTLPHSMPSCNYLGILYYLVL